MEQFWHTKLSATFDHLVRESVSSLYPRPPKLPHRGGDGTSQVTRRLVEEAAAGDRALGATPWIELASIVEHDGQLADAQSWMPSNLSSVIAF